MGFAEGGVSIPFSTMNIAPGDQLPLIKHLGEVPSQGNIRRFRKQSLTLDQATYLIGLFLYEVKFSKEPIRSTKIYIKIVLKIYLHSTLYRFLLKTFPLSRKLYSKEKSDTTTH